MIEKRPGIRFMGALGLVVLAASAASAAEPRHTEGHVHPGAAAVPAPAGPNRVLPAALREEAGRWVPTFPGSDHLAMERRPGGAR